jgi:hypothetical protein
MSISATLLTVVVSCIPSQTGRTDPAAKPDGDDVLAALSRAVVASTLDIELDRFIVDHGPPVERNHMRMADGTQVSFGELLKRQIAARYGDGTPPPDDVDVRTLKDFESGRLRLEPPTPQRWYRERWRIAADGSFRKDEYQFEPGQAVPEPVPWQRSWVWLAPGRAGAGAYALEYGRKIVTAFGDRTRWGFTDWRTLGTPAFVCPALLRSPGSSGDHPSPLKVLSIAARAASPGVAAGETVTLGLQPGQVLYEFVVDSKDATRAYESSVFDLTGGPRKRVTCDDFSKFAGSMLLPRKAEIVDYRQASAVRRDQIDVIRATSDAAEVERGLERSALSPPGWTAWDATRDQPTTR